MGKKSKGRSFSLRKLWPFGKKDKESSGRPSLPKEAAPKKSLWQKMNSKVKSGSSKKLKFDLDQIKNVANSDKVVQMQEKLESLPSFSEILSRTKTFLLPALVLAGLVLGLLIFELLFLFVFKEKGAGAPPPVSVSSGTANKYYLLDRPEYKSIVEKNIFCPGCPIPDLASRLAAEPKSCDVAESLSGPVKLVGTIVLSNPKFSVATFSHGAETETLRTGESYKNYGKIFEIRRERVCFEDAEGNILFVSLPNIDQLNIATPSRSKKKTNTRPSRPLPKVEGIAVTEDEIEIKRDFLMKAIADPKTLRDAYATPYRENGEIRGFRINSINPGSVYEAMGFQAGDILSEVDGSALDSIAKAQELFAAITNTNEANVTFLRNGNPVTKTFKVK